MTAPAPASRRRNGRLGLTAALCAVFVAGMVGMSFAAVPLYRMFCQLTGYGGTTQRAETAPLKSIDRVIKVRFDANIGNGLAWSFRPLQREVSLKVGAVGQADFETVNRGLKRSSATAAFNVTPGEAGVYFNKLSCFCFTTQSLDPGATVKMPVVFFVDPAIADDPDLAGVDTITLSYTFYPADEPAPKVKPVAVAEPARAAGSL